jgi:uncharacterized protein YdhG (YjbR/CyaY superfamily)
MGLQFHNCLGEGGHGSYSTRLALCSLCAKILTVMKKSARSKVNASNRSAPKTVEDYLSRVAEPARSTLEKVRATIRSVVPDESTEVISYQIPAFKYQKVLVWYAAFSEHCSLFPTASVIEQFRDELKGYPISKGTIRFPSNQPPPASLIKKLVKARLAQVK